jgi:hypothetical protein
MKKVIDTFELLHRMISTKDFLEMKSLGGEIPFFIAPFSSKNQVEVDKSIKGLKNKLGNQGIAVLEINLYELAFSILDQELGEGEIFVLEQQVDKTEFKEALQSVLDVNEVLIPAIKRLIDNSPAKLYFLTGIGLVFPFLRSHNILNNLQNVAKSGPTIIFFPGVYTGHSLELFGLLKDDNYYRAFNIDNYQLKP